MIHLIKSNNPSFKTIKFKPGFNVVLAERTIESTNRDSRNGLGKSTLIDIIHYCLGSQKGGTLRKKELEGWAFTLDIDLIGKKYSVTRSTSEQNRIIIEGDCSNWPIKPNIDKKTGEQILSQNDWNRALGVLMFDLNFSFGDIKYVPTFRSLISYFIRRDGQSGAFLNPFQHFKNQLAWNIQVNNSYLLGLGWEYASKWKVLKDREKILAQIKQEAQTAFLTDVIGSIGELEATKIRLEAQANQQEKNLKSFRVHPQYVELETDANNLTRQIHDLVNANINDKRFFEFYQLSLKEEIDANPELVKKIYDEAGISLPGVAYKRIEDVLAFHKQVVLNRKDFLKVEMERIKNSIVKREQKKQELLTKRAELMSVLQKHGALEEYTRLQGNYQGTISELEDLKKRIGNLKKFKQSKSAIIVEQEFLQQEALNDLSEREKQKEKAILLFNSNSQTLYEAPGTLSIDILKSGYKFGVNIKGQGSHGKSNMEIFCYDLVLAQIWAEKTKSAGLLIHDSIIFADVDERQKALALQLAVKESEKLGFQYICTMNSDTIPKKDFSDDFNFNSYVRLTLTDASDDGGLLGIRF